MTLTTITMRKKVLARGRPIAGRKHSTLRSMAAIRLRMRVAERGECVP